MEKYIPIACQFYDVLELNASRKKEVEIAFFETPEQVKTVKSVIKDLKTKDKMEYMILSDGTEIRLDQVISVGDVQFYGSCGF